MTCKLPLNPMPPVRTYTNDLFLNAILSANCGDSDLFASITVKYFCSDEFTVIKTSNSNLVVNNENIELYGNKSNKTTKVTMYKEVDANEEFIVRVNSHQYNSSWSTINIFAAENLNFENTSICRVGLFSNNQVCCGCKEEGVSFSNVSDKYSIRKPYFLKISLGSDTLSGLISLDGEKWDKLCEIQEQEMKSKNLIVGIEMNFEPNIYWAWLYSSYIHFAYTNDEIVHTWYLSAPRRNYSYCTYNPLVTFIRERVDFLLEKYDSIVEYIKLNLQKERYVELYFDEFYVPQMSIYNKEHRLHGNLAYGFNDTYIFFLGVKNGKPLEFKLTYEEVIAGCQSALKIDTFNMLTVYEFNPESYKFNLTSLYKSLRDYLRGIIDNIEFYNVDSDCCIYDIKVFDSFSNDVGLHNFMTDIRIPFIVNEHTQLMRERVEYLVKSDIVPENEIDNITSMLNNICEQTSIVLALTIKYLITDADDIPVKVSKRLKNIQIDQKNCYSRILELLRPHIDVSRIIDL